MESLVQDYPAVLLDVHEPPCLSLYQPTHRHHPENRQDPIRFRNLVRAMEESVGQKYPTREVHGLLEPFRALAGDRDFWNHTLDGLAVLGAPGLFRVYRLMRILQSVDRFHVLGLSRREVKLFEGNRDVLDEIELAPGVPRTIIEALGEELTEPHLTVASYGTGAGGPAMHHGHGSKKDEVDIDAERFFRAIDRAVLEHHSQPSGLPLMLAALPEHHALFRQVSHNPFLMTAGIDIHPDAVSLDALRESSLVPWQTRRLTICSTTWGSWC